MSRSIAHTVALAHYTRTISDEVLFTFCFQFQWPDFWINMSTRTCAPQSEFQSPHCLMCDSQLTPFARLIYTILRAEYSSNGSLPPSPPDGESLLKIIDMARPPHKSLSFFTLGSAVVGGHCRFSSLQSHIPWFNRRLENHPSAGKSRIREHPTPQVHRGTRDHLTFPTRPGGSCVISEPSTTTVSKLVALFRPGVDGCPS